jgi:hypothetical protein
MPARLARGAATIRLCLGYGHTIIWKKYYELYLEKYSARPITSSHNGILTNCFLSSNGGTL